MEIQDIYIARQPIVTAADELFGFELLFRDAPGIARPDDTRATATVMVHAFTEMGLASVLGGLRGFVNANAELLHSDLIEILPADHLVLEVLETTVVDPALVERCGELCDRGFMLALDDYCGDFASIEPLLRYAQVVKVDLTLVPPEALDAVVAPLKRAGVRLLAEKVETREEFERCRRAGFHLFQGYYFAKPQLLTAKRTTPAKAGMVRLLALAFGNADNAAIEEEFKHQPNFGINLLRLANSAANRTAQKIRSIRHALVMLGRRQLQIWLQMLLYMGERPGRQLLSPLLQTAAMRARLMELLARRNWPRLSELHDYAFITGMLSLVDVLLGITRAEILRELNLAEEVQTALLEERGWLGDLLQLAQALERDDRAIVSALLGGALNITAAELTAVELEAFRWANTLFDAPAAAPLTSTAATGGGN